MIVGYVSFFYIGGANVDDNIMVSKVDAAWERTG
jgi:hypothetical protein